MKTFYALIILLFYVCCGCATNKGENIIFKPISGAEFNYAADSSFAIPHGKIWDERKRIHDSCMGSSYEANAILLRTKDTFMVGGIVDMKTMKVVKGLDLRNLFGDLPSALLFNTKPCYEKRAIEIPIDSFMNNNFPLRIDSSNEKINTELKEAMRNSIHTEISTGSWLNMELTDAWGKILDTTTDENLLEYKKILLQPDNMILVRSSSVTEISFYFQTKDLLPADLKNKLLTKPTTAGQADIKAQFFYLNDNSFKLTLNGYFQVVGQFMKCEAE